MCTTLSSRFSLALVMLVACWTLPSTVQSQETESDDSQSQTQEQRESSQQTGQDQPDEQLPSEPTGEESSLQDTTSDDQSFQQRDDQQGAQQYDQQRYDQSRDDQPRDDRQQRDQFGETRERDFQQGQRPSQVPWDQQQRRNQRTRPQDQGVATDRARVGDRQTLEGDNRLQQRTEVQLTEDLGLQVTERQNGLAITDIDRSSVLIDSGLQRGDVLISVRNRPLRDRVQFVRWLRTLEPGARVPVQIIRDGRRETIYVTGIDFDRWQRRDRGWYETGADGGAYLGVVFDDRYPSMAVVEIVRRNTAAERAGLRPGDVIQRINGQRLNGLNHATALIGQMQPGDEVDIEFTRRTSGQAIARLGSRPDARQTTYYEGEDYSSYDGETRYYDDGPTTRYSEEIQTFEDDGRMRDDVRFGERDRIRERGPVRRALTRPFRTP